jgi:hypothetical protein
MAVLFLGLANEAENSLRRLTKTYDQHLQDGLDPDHAATKAVTEFGTVDEISEAFDRHSPGHRAAVTLLTPGPVVDRCWLVFLISGRAWTWPNAGTATLMGQRPIAILVRTLSANPTGSSSSRTSLPAGRRRYADRGQGW